MDATLMEMVGTVAIPATTEPFVASEHCVLGGDPKKITWLSDLFREWFWGKIEPPMAKTELRYAKLTKNSVDGPIMDELGGVKETTLAEIYALMKRQPNGEQGVLLTNGWANIFYIRDQKSVLRTVYVSGHGDGWSVGADFFGFLYGWRIGRQVFSRLA